MESMMTNQNNPEWDGFCPWHRNTQLDWDGMTFLGMKEGSDEMGSWWRCPQGHLVVRDSRGRIFFIPNNWGVKQPWESWEQMKK